MFNFITLQDGDRAVALLVDDNGNCTQGAGYMTFFKANDFKTSVNCQIAVDDETVRSSLCLHAHNRHGIGATYSDQLVYV